MATHTADLVSALVNSSNTYRAQMRALRAPSLETELSDIYLNENSEPLTPAQLMAY